MWWGKGSDKPKDSVPEQAKEVAKEVKEAAKDFDKDKLPDRRQLPKKLQQIVDKEDKQENFYNEIVEGYAPPSTDSNVRYAAYASRLRTILLSAHRYVAYTSDIGESFRPVAHPYLVRGAYGISWAYILGDVSYEGYKAYWSNRRKLDPSLQLTPLQQRAVGLEAADPLPAPASGDAAQALQQQPGVVAPLEDWRTVVVQRAIFQSVASMGLPALTIHSVVRYSGRAMKNLKNKTVRTWGPIGLGLAVVPLLPSLFDKPVENTVEWVFHKGFETFGGHSAVGDNPKTGREKELGKKPPKEKEL